MSSKFSEQDLQVKNMTNFLIESEKNKALLQNNLNKTK